MIRVERVRGNVHVERNRCMVRVERNRHMVRVERGRRLVRVERIRVDRNRHMVSVERDRCMVHVQRNRRMVRVERNHRLVMVDHPPGKHTNRRQTQGIRDRRLRHGGIRSVSSVMTLRRNQRWAGSLMHTAKTIWLYCAVATASLQGWTRRNERAYRM